MFVDNEWSVEAHGYEIFGAAHRRLKVPLMLYIRGLKPPVIQQMRSPKTRNWRLSAGALGRRESLRTLFISADAR